VPRARPSNCAGNRYESKGASAANPPPGRGSNPRVARELLAGRRDHGAREGLDQALADAEELRAGLVAAQEDREALERTHARELEALRGELDQARGQLERNRAELEEARRAAAEQAERAAELQRELDTTRRAESDAREALAAEHAAREGAERSAVDARALAEQAQRTAEQLIASEQARAQEAREAAQEARAERDRALERASSADKQAERLQDRVTGLEARLEVAQQGFGEDPCRIERLAATAPPSSASGPPGASGRATCFPFEIPERQSASARGRLLLVVRSGPLLGFVSPGAK
jgi:hypothetical protein